MKTTGSGNAVENFFDALTISNPRARIRILYARAYEMTSEELLEARRKWVLNRQERLKRLIELDAPQIIIDNARKMLDKGTVSILINKVLRERA